MDKARPKVFKRRHFLRPQNGYGNHTAVVAMVASADAKLKNGKRAPGTGYVEGSFDIRDCSDQISLQCWAHNRKHLKAHIKAVDTLIDDLQDFRDAMEAHGNHIWD